MLKRKLMILSILVFAFLSCTQSAHIVGAEEKLRPLHPGTTLVECKLLQEGGDPIYIKVERSRNDLCAEVVTQHKNSDCTAPVSKDEIPVVEGERIPDEAYSGTGNQFCPEAIVVFRHSPRCYQYTSGGRTRYIPPGCNNW